MKVRAAFDEDLDWLVSELRNFAEFYGSKHSLSGDEQFWRDGLLNIIQNHVVFIAEKTTMSNKRKMNKFVDAWAERMFEAHDAKDDSLMNTVVVK